MPKFVDALIRRQEVVDAVFRIIAADGLERASLREVADEAQLAVGSVRHYFASSDELLTHAFAVVVDRIVGRLTDADSRLGDTPPGSEEQHAAVLALLGGVLWLLKTGMLSRFAARSSAVAVETAVSLGERRQLVIVSVEGRRLLLGCRRSP